MSGRNAFAVTAGTNYILLVAGAITGVLAARLLGPTGRGQLAAIQLWPMLLASLALLGLPEALVFCSSRRVAESGQALTTAVLLAAAASVAAAVVGFLAMPRLLASQPSGIVDTARLYLVLTLASGVGLSIHLLRARSMFLAWNLIRLLPQMAWLCILVAASVFSLQSPILLAKISIVSGLALCVPYLIVAIAVAAPPYGPRRDLVRPLLMYGLPGVLTVLPQTFNLRLDQVALAAALPSNQLGLYVTAVGWSGAVTPALSALGSVMFPRIASLAGASDQVSTLSKGVRISVILGLTGGAGLALVTPFVLPMLFGASFEAATPAALLLIAAAVVAGFNLVLGECLRGVGHPSTVLRSEIGGLVVTAAALWILLPPLGIIGAAVASLLSYCTTFVMLALSVSRRLSLPLRFFLIPKHEDYRLLVRVAINGLTRLRHFLNRATR